MNYYFDVLRKYVDFTGRARRKEFWMFFLISLIIGFVIAFMERLTGLAKGDEDGILSNLYYLFICLPSMALSVRRLHDIGKSGWWVLASIIPILGIILVVIYHIREGNAGTNQYGPDPKLTPVRI